MPYLFADTETNGLPADYHAPASDAGNWPEPVQIAWVLTDNQGAELGRRNCLIKPSEGFVLDEGAAAAHGLTLEQLAEGQAIEFVLFDLSMVLLEHPGIVLVAHNLAFDFSILSAALHRAGMASTAAHLASLQGICTMERSTAFVGIPSTRRGQAYKWPKLIELYLKLFGEGFDGAHDAMNDVEALRRCFWALRERGVIGDAGPIRYAASGMRGLA